MFISEFLSTKEGGEGESSPKIGLNIFFAYSTISMKNNRNQAIENPDLPSKTD